MIGKRELVRQLKAKDSTIEELTLQLREVRERLDVELQHRENLTVAENTNADEVAAIVRVNERLKEDVKRCNEEVANWKDFVDTLKGITNARTICEVIRHGEPDGEGGFRLKDFKVDVDYTLKNWDLAVIAEDDERFLKVTPHEVQKPEDPKND